MPNLVRTLLVGISGYGHAYLKPLLSEQGAATSDLVAVADPTPQACQSIDELRQRHIPIYASLTEALDHCPDVELVCLSTPIHLHAEQTCEALRAGANVLCEKPLAGCIRDAERIIHAEAASNAFVAIGYQWSFTRAVQQLKRDILAGRLGRPRRLRSWVAFPRPTSYFNRNGWVGRRRTPDGVATNDSPVNNATSHYLHNMLYVLGSSRDRSAMPRTMQAELYRVNDVETYDTAALRCEMEDDAEILFYTSHATTEYKLQVRMEFEHATVTYEPQDCTRVFIARFNDGREIDYGSPELERDAKIWQCLDSVRSGKPVACGPTAALPQTSCMEAADRSAGDVVDFPSSCVQHLELGSGVHRCVDGLDVVMEDCFAQGVLPSDHPAAVWARPGRVVPVRGTRERLAAPLAAEAAAGTTAARY